MKYDPASKTVGATDNPLMEWLMMPFAQTQDETDWEMVELIQQCMSTLSDSDRQALEGIYYERQTYQELAATLNIRAKSHAWRKTESAIKNLRKAIINNDELMSILQEKYGI
jgi:DNA-directed RNA polymerase specialized sigma24 family protein